ncbi:hypothetical protein PC9H_008892 [Pleurotus ostreatus]|uniref:DUF6589 domain-containing protein n=1 Tax=Pleurotus ostreatus TaxID=5322 RepID=A0A8H6ZPU2_PLEOS|nr:uncharacterized protein PC9H_008892 [Pleurotus ostreatus]KAF7426523.1 hypothetical protein PC9H_008892 [Pleurotus ostreatus]
MCDDNMLNNLPPSSPPPDYGSDVSDGTMLPIATSDDIPLAEAFKQFSSTTLIGEQALTSEDIPLARLHGSGDHICDEEITEDRGILTDTSLFSEDTERKVLAARSEVRRQEARTASKANAANEELRKAKEEEAHITLAWQEHTLAKEKVFNEILDRLRSNGHTLAEFLEYVFNPSRRFSFDWRWAGFWRDHTTVRQIFEHWSSSTYNKSSRTTYNDIIVSLAENIVQTESQGITDSKLLNRTVKTVDEGFFLGYDVWQLGRKLREKAPLAFRLFNAFASTTRQRQRGVSQKWADKKEVLTTSAAFTLLKAASSNNSYPQAVIGTYLMSTGAQRQHLSVATTLGLSVSYPNIIHHARRENTVSEDTDNSEESEAIDEEDSPSPSQTPMPTLKKIAQRRAPGTLSQLSDACRQTARDVAKTGLFVTVYDNINMMFQVAEQILGRKNAQENGTCATIFPLFRAAEEDMSAEAYQHSLMNAPPLTLDDILLTSSEQALHEASMRHTLLRVIVEHGGIGFEKWKPRLQETLPKSKSKIQPLKGADGRPLPITTPIHPLPAMEIDESSIVGNVDVINTIDKELRLNQKGVNYLKFVRIMGGDQLTIARQRSVLNVHAGHESGFHAWQHVVLMPGLFHAKIADCHGILETHFGLPNAGQQSPGSLCFHNTVMDRLPVVLSSLPTFRVVRDLITVSLYAHILHCLLRVSGKATIEEYTSSVTSWATIEEHANQIYQKFVNADVVTKLRDQRAAEEQVQARAIRKKKRPEGEAPKEYEHIAKGDMVFENGVLFIRDALLTREFADAVKAGDSGRVVIILKLWALAYRGSGRSKYAHEMLHVIYNIQHLWPPGLM